MKCDICQKRNATIHIQQVAGDEEIDLHLCERCAAHKGITTGEDQPDFSISRLLNGLIEIDNRISKLKGKKVCPRCGMTLEKIQSTATLGCNECYSVFAVEVREIIHKSMGKVQHRGKYPGRILAFKTYLIDMEELKRKLNRAVKEERYEEAAELRDKIEELNRSSEVRNV